MLDETDAISWPKMYPQLRYTFSNRRGITQKTTVQTQNTVGNSFNGGFVHQLVQPIFENECLTDYDHSSLIEDNAVASI